MKLWSLNTQDIGVDLGTTNTIFTIKDKGIVLREATVVAINQKNNEIIETGEEAEQLLIRNPENIFPIYPIKDGVISDLSATTLMIKNMLNKIEKQYNIGKPLILVSVPVEITEVEKKALETVFLQNGARQVFLIKNPLAAAVGLKKDCLKPEGNMIVNIGAETIESTIISYGNIIVNKSVNIGSKNINMEIIKYLKRAENIIINNEVAEKLKIEYGAAQGQVTDNKIEIVAKSISTGLPKKVVIHSTQIEVAMENIVEEIVENIIETLSNVPAELAGDIVKNGIYLIGGGSQIKALDNLVANRTKIKTYIIENPTDIIACGLSEIINNIDKYKKIIRG